MTEINNKSQFGLNAGNLKMIALFCMTLDHFAVAILDSLMMKGQGGRSIITVVLYLILRLIGRVAFPIYCFFIAEGYERTHNKLKYLLRLFLLAVISEVPFDMVLFHKFFSMGACNVFWTLSLGLVTIWITDSYERIKDKKVLVFIVRLIISMGAFLLADAFETDYSSVGILTILLMFWVKKGEKWLSAALTVLAFLSGMLVNGIDLGSEGYIEIAIGLFCVCLIAFTAGKKFAPICGAIALLLSDLTEITGFFAVPLIAMYNGQKGRMNKWLFYFYYPGHLLILVLLCILLGLY